MRISSNPMISVLHDIMWSVGKNVTHKAKGKNSKIYLSLGGPRWSNICGTSCEIPTTTLSEIIHDSEVQKTCEAF